mmetsp:Transcript_8484/g.12441  ORF Transcript_8484/g.12441 Transcript_8484/m.12441 type:complete len:87 (-) Transcript_8484:132-392(-)
MTEMNIHQKSEACSVHKQARLYANEERRTVGKLTTTIKQVCSRADSFQPCQSRNLSGHTINNRDGMVNCGWRLDAWKSDNVILTSK